MAVEIVPEYKGPDSTIHALCAVVEALSPVARRIWNRARKVFDIGYELRPSEQFCRFTLRHDRLQRVTKLGATIAVTCYRREATNPAAGKRNSA